MWVGCLGGFLISILSSMFGFGGGPFMVPLMTVALGLPMY
ncbi:MAG: sulfite exporter TauE/SafE family protein, partial [Deltaproteobacteria bacterium]|nr:sulfite exporter TauE/SafE family protein [Deltaproteobacteria bacterium]